MPVPVATVPTITSDMSPFDAALALARAGFHVFPVDHPELPRCVGIRTADHDPKTCGTRGKHTTLKYTEAATTDLKTIASWWAGAPRNVGIFCGASSLVVVDEDAPGELDRFAAEHQVEIPPTLVVATAKGRHFYFRARPNVALGNVEGAFRDYDINIRGGNAYVVAPGSVHKTGVVYKITDPTAPAPVPGWVIEAVNTRPAGANGHTRRGLDKVPEVIRHRHRDNEIFAYAASLRARSVASAEAEILLRPVWERCEQPSGDPYTWAEALAKLTSVYDRYPEGRSDGHRDTELPELPELPSAAEPAEWVQFWESRPVHTRMLEWARARRVGPWAMLGCVLARIVAASSIRVVLPALVGGNVSLNLFVALVDASGGGKGSAEQAAIDAIDMPGVATFGPGSGEGVAHLFVHRNKAGELVRHRDAVVLSAAEVDTLSALKTRQASTLLPELRKAWMGEPLGFAYVDPAKSLEVARHSYRLCMIVGVQPATAAPLLEDVGAGTPQRFLWLPTGDPDAPDERPEEPQRWKWSTMHDPITGAHALRPMTVCQTAKTEVETVRLQRLRGRTSEDLDGHALLAQLKVAAALALLDGRTTEITDKDWQLAGVVRAVSDRTRQRVVDTLARSKAQNNRARGEAEAERAILVNSRVADHATKRVGRAIMRKLEAAAGWVARSQLRGALATPDRPYFDAAIAALIDAGQVQERAIQTSHSGHQGTEYRKTP